MRNSSSRAEVWHGEVWPAAARCGEIGLGLARQGLARCCVLWHGEPGLGAERRGTPGFGSARHGTVWTVLAQSLRAALEAVLVGIPSGRG